MQYQTRHRHRRLMLALLLSAILGISVALAQTGGGYDLTWSTIDAGGGNSTGGEYQLAGTLGQPEAGPALSGGAYSLVGGFWGAASTGSTIYLPRVLH